MNIIITGASSGIGYETAKLFAVQGEHHVIAISRTSSLLSKLEEDCKAINSKSKLIPIAYDLTDSGNFEELINRIKGLLPDKTLDLLINNAGFLINKPFKDIRPEELDKVYSVNLFSPFRLIQMLLPNLMKSKSAQILNIGSMGGMNGTAKFSGLSAYSSSKGALSILTECLAEELKEEGIRVNCIALGSVNTPMLNSAFPGYKASAEPCDVADFIYNFTQRNSRLFNGKTIPVSSSTP
jgi:NAD(P)-dependent dehydrogenase (short-subunit alcohol dehydrogenase family)